MSTAIQVRIDESVKERAKEEFEAMGLDMSTAIKLFLYKVISEHRIPFSIERTMKVKPNFTKLSINSKGIAELPSDFPRELEEAW